ncbi:MAG TPA: hypothetical protein VI381_06820 [Allosphingosinicella sp.]
MRIFLLAAGAASLAIAMPALAQGKGNGHGHGGGKGHAGQMSHPGKAQGFKSARPGKGPDRAFEDGRKGRPMFAKAEAKSVQRVADRERDRLRPLERARARDVERIVYRDDDERFGSRTAVRRFAAYGCPPGLAKKSPACVPPGQARRAWNVGQAIPPAYYGGYNLPAAYRDFYRDNDDYYYRYGDGYIYRVDRDRNVVSSLIPLLGGGFGVGSMLPAGYGVYNVPLQYRDMYYDNDDYHYRYGDGAIYRVDPQTNLVNGVVALLTNDLRVGQPLPAGYGVYNVPLAYRDQYYDTDNAWYRYADNSIYQVDPTTQLITAVISLLT